VYVPREPVLKVADAAFDLKSEHLRQNEFDDTACIPGFKQHDRVATRHAMDDAGLFKRSINESPRSIHERVHVSL
jgi:hypothetical protein